MTSTAASVPSSACTEGAPQTEQPQVQRSPCQDKPPAAGPPVSDAAERGAAVRHGRDPQQGTGGGGVEAPTCSCQESWVVMPPGWNSPPRRLAWCLHPHLLGVKQRVFRSSRPFVNKSGKAVRRGTLGCFFLVAALQAVSEFGDVEKDHSNGRFLCTGTRKGAPGGIWQAPVRFRKLD